MTTQTLATIPAGPGAATSRQQLGHHLRRLRHARALKLQDAATALGITPSTLSRIETGKAPARTSYITILLDLYQVTDPARRARFIDLASQGRQAEWPAQNRALLPDLAHDPGISGSSRL